MAAARPVLSAANSEDGAADRPGKLPRYVDPDRQRTKAALAAANAATKARRDADQRRRAAVGCRNAHPSILDGPRACACAYCEPDEHLLGAEETDQAWTIPRCICGERVPAPGERCLAHGTELEILDGDPAARQELAASRRHEPPTPNTGTAYAQPAPTI